MVSLTSTLATGAASGDAVLDAPGLDVLLSGHTGYVTPPGGEATVLSGVDGRRATALPNGAALVGHWTIGSPNQCVDWEKGPQNRCTSVTNTDAAIAFADIATREPQGNVARIVPGNVEEL